MATILDSLRSLVTPELLAQASTLLGESQGNVSRGLAAAGPAILGGLLAKTNDTGVMRQVMDLLGDRTLESGPIRNAGSLLGGGGLAQSPLIELGGRFLSSIFGPQVGSIANALAGHAGLKSSSASTLLGLAAPLVMSVLGDRVRRDGLNAAGLASLLGSERGGILREIPAGLTGLLGLGAAPRAAIGETYAEPARRQRSWLPAAVVAALLALAAVWALQRDRTPEQTATAPAPTGQAPTTARVPAAAPAPAGQPATAPAAGAPGTFSKRLPSNFDLRAPATGIEERMVVFIEDPGKRADPAVWFEFDRLLFETGSAELKPESREQLRNVAEIMKSYPKVKAKIGGYTDNVGDDAANLKLSQDRATNVMSELVVLGVTSDRLSAEGYGEQHPVADNATEEGRQQNRRIALHVTEK